MLRKGHILVILVIGFSFVTVPAFAQEMGWYENELYDFSFNSPSTWDYVEDIELYEDLPPFQVVFFVPSDIIDEGVYPQIGVMYEFVSSSLVPTLNEKTVEDYVTGQIISTIPTGRLTSSSVESNSWGWVVSTEFFETVEDSNVLTENFEFLEKSEKFTVFYDMRSYFFKNGDVYNVEFSSEERYFDTYHPEFETLLDSLVIKGVVVPEFQEIAMMVLASSIVLGIVFARKFSESVK